jgi:dipeptidase
MFMKRPLVIFFLLAIAVVIVQPYPAQEVLEQSEMVRGQQGCESCDVKACTAIGIGKNATWDGSTICTQSADCGECDFTLHYVSAADHKAGSTKQIRKWTQLSDGYVNKPGAIIAEIPETEHTYAYFRAVFGFMNERGLAIGESTISSRPELYPANDSEAVFDVTELSMIAMEKCTRAKEAIELMGSLAEEFGFKGSWAGEALIIADGDEVWVFEIHPSDAHWKRSSGSGAVWCAERVPDDGFVVVPNESIIKEVNLKNDSFMASDNVFDVALKNDWWDGKEPFRWDLAYSNRKAGSLRTWRALSLAAPSLGLKPGAEDYPFCVRPDKKMTFFDVRDLHGDHFEGTAFDQTRGLAAGPFGDPNWPRANPEVEEYKPDRSIAIMNSEYVVINQVRGWMPDPVKGVSWWGVDDGDTNCYVPFYCGVTRLPEAYSVGDHHALDLNSAFWIFNLAGNWAQLRYRDMIKKINVEQRRIENSELSAQPSIDKKAMEFYNKDPDKAREFLTEYCLRNADNVLNRWRSLLNELVSEYDDNGGGPAPAWWCETVTESG